MGKKLFLMSMAALFVISIALVGCKAKVDKQAEVPMAESTETFAQTEAMLSQQAQAVVEPSQTVATETIPPSAAVPQAVQNAAATATQMVVDRAKDIQTALKNAGFYIGAIDGKIGPNSKKAIMEFQAAKGLKVDGKVGPKTWAELEKYLVRQ